MFAVSCRLKSVLLYIRLLNKVWNFWPDVHRLTVM